ncbi:hypothetical protein [Enterovirga rhinocerotis]|uniref:Uncharacterized protein n=1 Tax=Enterovirga rhinocerotis TaxID=1339210 RepID=A0A4R7CFD3_9HYPH|nr:hypothetical protein [Enterovirga rhinocerotis]TDR95663.1 hypothetical protein EV668_0045 [Enterovirga rhinocerotis]
MPVIVGLMMRAAPTIALVGVGAATGVWVPDRAPPVNTLSAVALNPAVAPGETLRIRYEIEQLRSCATIIDRVLFDGDGVRYNLADLAYAAAPGPIGRDGYTVALPIPRTFAAGPSAYRIVIRYECNVLHKLWPIIRGEVPVETRGPAAPEGLPIGPRTSDRWGADTRWRLNAEQTWFNSRSGPRGGLTAQLFIPQEIRSAEISIGGSSGSARTGVFHSPESEHLSHSIARRTRPDLVPNA